jgi:hypothetical protein
MTEAHLPAETVTILRAVGERLRIQGEYGPGWSDVADATACDLGAAEIDRLRAALERIAAGIHRAVNNPKQSIAESSNPLNGLLHRLQADGGRYLLSVGLTHAEMDAAEKPTFGGKATQRWLTDKERTALCQLLEGEHYISCEQHGLVPDLAALDHKCYGCEIERLRAALERIHNLAFSMGGPDSIFDISRESLRGADEIQAMARQGDEQ